MKCQYHHCHLGLQSPKIVEMWKRSGEKKFETRNDRLQKLKGEANFLKEEEFLRRLEVL
jgi:hypothetical protein